MTRKLYVGNLPHPITEKELRALFAAVGDVAHIALVPGNKEHPNGHAYVEMRTEEAAVAALKRLNGHKWQHHTLKVRETAEVNGQHSI